MSASSAAERVVRCPACSGPAVYGERNPWRPFCSERCRHHDLGAWASESYRVTADEASPQEATANSREPPLPH